MMFGLLGKDISYSQSPKIFQVFQHYTKLDLSYSLFDVEKDQVKDYIEQLRKGYIQGLQVTKPYKEFVMSLCDELSETAKNIGSVNTIYVRDSKVIGDNTDAYGFQQLLADYEVTLLHKQVCILGNGGAAKSVYYVCKEHGVEPMIFKRDTSQQDPITDKEFNYEDTLITQCQVIIQATSHDFDEALISKWKSLGCQPEVVIDLIYHKRTSVLSLSDRSYNGKLMLIYQAMKSFELFINKPLNHQDLIIEQLKGV